MRVVSQRLATPVESFYITLQDEETRASVPRLNESISRMLTLATALAGGSLVFLKGDVCDPVARMFAAVCFFLSLGVTAVGLIPAQGRFSQDVDALRKQRLAAVRWKRRILIAACLGLALGLLAAIVGVGIKTIR